MLGQNSKAAVKVASSAKRVLVFKFSFRNRIIIYSGFSLLQYLRDLTGFVSGFFSFLLCLPKFDVYKDVLLWLWPFMYRFFFSLINSVTGLEHQARFAGFW